MPIAQVGKIYNKKEIKEFSSFEKQMLKEWNNTIPHIFENTKVVSNLVSLFEKLDVLETVFGMLDELSPKQRETFEEAVKRRSLFK
ncbi:MAG: hypothetical protein QMD71_01625 [bacterium]|nr:hypothetical protein [bacterium]